MVDKITGGGVPPFFPEEDKKPLLGDAEVQKADQMLGVIGSVDTQPKKTRLGGVTTKTKIEETGHNPQTEQLRQNAISSNQFLMAIMALVFIYRR